MICPGMKILALVALMAYAASAAVAALGRAPGGRGRYFLAFLAGGIGFNAAALAWTVARGQFVDAGRFSALALAALVIGAAAAASHAARAARMAKAMLLPLMAVCLCLLLAILAATFPASDVWGIGHIALAIAGTACFGAAACGGGIYLRASGRLRSKDAGIVTAHWPSLERLDRFVRRALLVGFALLTAAIAAGLVEALLPRGGRWFWNWQTHPKTLAAVIAWVVYTIALYTAYGRRFRPARTAALSIAGFVLLMGVLLASTLVRKTP